MQTLKVNIPDREYQIKIEKGILCKAGDLLSQLFSPCKAAIITDSTVGPLYAKILENSLSAIGFSPFVVTVPAGEGSKSSQMLNFLYDQLLSNCITRSDLIIALGGGVVGDLTGFCAATLLRGIPFVQIPTTLLAQVDSSVGGKVAINLPQGKNLVGSFYQPKLVIIDPECLKTLSDRNFSDGMAEVIKYGAILDEDLYKKLEGACSRADMMNIIEEVIYRCCDLKRIVVEDDETDQGGRMILNFGHTFGHAIEKKYNFKDYTHGEAVAIGMIMAAEFGESLGITKPGTKARLCELISNHNLPTKASIDHKSLIDAINVDKKGKGSLVSLIIPKKIGRVIIKDMEKDNIWIQ